MIFSVYPVLLRGLILKIWFLVVLKYCTFTRFVFCVKEPKDFFNLVTMTYPQPHFLPPPSVYHWLNSRGLVDCPTFNQWTLGGSSEVMDKSLIFRTDTLDSRALELRRNTHPRVKQFLKKPLNARVFRPARYVVNRRTVALAQGHKCLPLLLSLRQHAPPRHRDNSQKLGYGRLITPTPHATH